MQNAAMWLASIFGPLLVIIGLWKLLYSDMLIKVLHAVKNSHGLMYYSSVIYIWIGFTVLSQYDLWGMNALVLVTLLGWVMVVRGILGLFVPQMLVDMYMSRSAFIKVCGIIPLVWGLVLCWVGFFM
ncbi:MAG: hypothetical protein ACRENF_05005 [Thermodesulfobacteriota bacterium]